MRILRIGTRGSKLALWQADFVCTSLQRYYPGQSFERVIIKTEGDQDQHSSLKQIGGQGVFTKAIESALLRGEIDMAIHSLKDLPSRMTVSLVLGAVPERGSVADALITREGLSLEQLPEKAKVATGSIRRQSQVLYRRPDLEIRDLRGNIDTRIRKLTESDLDAIIMAKAALDRLAISGIKYSVFPMDAMIPAVGQGAVGVQIREEDREVYDLVSKINHEKTHLEVTAERTMLYTLDSGCQFPVGAYAFIDGEVLHLTAYVGSEDGETAIYESATYDPEKPVEAGKNIAEKLIRKGALKILDFYSGKAIKK